ncbi:MAG: glycosyltransferase family 2 protein [Pseudomonadota bacterium]|nr:glycosyltransferase family 2 protein [Pseudomonadota bacterium]
MASLSVIIITHNEAHNIEACLRSVAFADEVVVLDSGSTDDTLQLARAMGASVSTSPDWPGFGAQKNRALDAASCEWVFSIDADERVTPELAQEIQRQLSQIPSESRPPALEIPRLTQFCGVWIRHCGWTPDYVLRVFKRGEARFSDDLVHEKLQLLHPDTPVVRLKNPLLHYSYPTPEHYWRKLQRYSQDWARQRHARGQKTTIARAALSAMTAFIRSYVFQRGFLDGAMGFAVCTMQAQSAFGKYFELYCLGRQNEK